MASVSRMEKGKLGCQSSAMREDVLQQAVVTPLNEVYRGNGSIIPMLQE